jgi:hypothetical protein
VFADVLVFVLKAATRGCCPACQGEGGGKLLATGVLDRFEDKTDAKVLEKSEPFK